MTAHVTPPAGKKVAGRPLVWGRSPRRVQGNDWVAPQYPEAHAYGKFSGFTGLPGPEPEIAGYVATGNDPPKALQINKINDIERPNLAYFH